MNYDLTQVPFAGGSSFDFLLFFLSLPLSLLLGCHEGEVVGLGTTVRTQLLQGPEQKFRV